MPEKKPIEGQPSIREFKVKANVLSVRRGTPSEDRNVAKQEKTAKTDKPRSESSIRAEIAEIFARHAESGDIDDAAQAAINEISDRGIPIELTSSIILDYARTRVCRAQGVMRTALRAGQHGDERKAAIVNASGWTWLSNYFVNGVPLCDCGADELRRSAAKKREMAYGMNNAAEFESRLADRVGNKTVRMVFSDQQVQKIHDSVME
jgi:hypothetical protein